MQFNNTTKKWLEIMFYVLCNRIFCLNNSLTDVIKFIEGMQWTNLYNCDKLINTITKNKILLDDTFKPSLKEICLVLFDEDAPFKIEKKAVVLLLEDTKYKFDKRHIFAMRMVQEVRPIDLSPKLTEPGIHEEILNFIQTHKYMTNIFKRIKIFEDDNEE